MARSFICRVGVAQISVNPAYADELVTCIQEPTFPKENEKVGLFSISGLEEVGRLQQNLADKYITHLNHKVEEVVRFAARDGVELIVLPEYSIPPEALPLCHALSEELGVAIVAGSHVITLSESAQQIYRDLELTFEEGKKPADERVRQAACIVMVPKQKPIAFVKYVSSKWETCLVKGAPAFHTFEMSTKRGRIEVQVLICIEALSDKPTKEKRSIPRLVVITAFTPKVESFHDEGKRALLNGKCLLFANVTEFGGSRIFARADTASLWFSEKNGTAAIPVGSEALLVVEADLEKQFEVRQLITEHTAVTDLRVYPILYTTDSPETQQYSDMINLFASTNPRLAEMGTQVNPFTTLTARVFPKLLQEKLSHFVGHIVPAGIVSTPEAIKWVTPLVIPDIQSTNRLRWELCNQSMETVDALLRSVKYVHKAKELFEVYQHLLIGRNELSGSIQLRSEESGRTDPAISTAPPASAESPFIDRDPAFDKIRQFFNQQQSSFFLLGGMRGIGKSALVQEAFRQAIPPRKRIFLQMTEGISYQRLLAELAFQCNLQLPESLNLSNATTQEEVKKRVLSFLSQGPGAVVVFDEFQFLLNSSAEIEDPSIRVLLQGLAEAGQRGKTKYFVISHVFPKLGASFENFFMSYTLQGLQTPDARRLLIQWMQFARDDLAGSLPEPSEKLISVLGGHPLATKVAARLWADHPTADIAEEFSIFKELRDTIVGFILEKLKLSSQERDLLSFASIFRLPAPREVFLNWRKEDASYLLSSLAGHYLIESSERGYQLHPLVRSFFSNNLALEEAKAWHKIAGKFYLQEFERLKNASKQIVPEYLGEAVHHFLAAGERQKVRDFAFYGQELRPVALEHYRGGEYKVALKDYQVLLELDKNDVDANFHLSLIFARLGRWGDAELHFGKAISIRPKAPWILQAYGAAKLRAGKTTEGESLLLEAEKINSNHSPTLVELGRLRGKQGDSVKAEKYFRRAIDADPNNSYAYYQLSKLLYHEGDTRQAYEMAKAALVTNPLNARNKNLLQELKGKIAATAEVTKRTAPLVQVKCMSKNPNGTAAHERIAGIGGINSNGKRWKITCAEAISQIEQGKHAFYVVDSIGGRLDLTVAIAPSGEKYLKTATDKEQPESILLLPRCP
jgi:Tfp pilus assembly protein PilF